MTEAKFFLRRLVLDVGFPKTGTSARQAAFAASRSAMLAQGVVYPEHLPSEERVRDGLPSSGNGAKILFPGKGASFRLDRLAEEIHAVSRRRAHSLFYSSEFFSRIFSSRTSSREDLVAFLEAHFPQTELTLACTVRSPLSLAQSAYTYGLASSAIRADFESYLERFQWMKLLRECMEWVCKRSIKMEILVDGRTSEWEVFFTRILALRAGTLMPAASGLNGRATLEKIAKVIAENGLGGQFEQDASPNQAAIPKSSYAAVGKFEKKIESDLFAINHLLASSGKLATPTSEFRSLPEGNFRVYLTTRPRKERKFQ